MLIMFSGKGCRNCPFVCESQGLPVCNLYNRETTEGRLPRLEAHYKTKPKGCPFASFPGTLEIQAAEYE